MSPSVEDGVCSDCGIHQGGSHTLGCPQYEAVRATGHSDELVIEDTSDGVAVRGMPVPEEGRINWHPEGDVLLAVWDQLSERAKQDLMRCTKGSIIRCTRDDWDLIRGVQVVPDSNTAHRLNKLEAAVKAISEYCDIHTKVMERQTVSLKALDAWAQEVTRKLEVLDDWAQEIGPPYP